MHFFDVHTHSRCVMLLCNVLHVIINDHWSIHSNFYYALQRGKKRLYSIFFRGEKCGKSLSLFSYDSNRISKIEGSAHWKLLLVSVSSFFALSSRIYCSGRFQWHKLFTLKHILSKLIRFGMQKRKKQKLNIHIDYGSWRESGRNDCLKFNK